MARRVQTWETSCPAAYGVAAPALLLGDRFGTELNEMTQDVGASLSWIQRSSGVDGMGDLVGLGEQMARTDGRHRPSVSPTHTVQHQGWLVGTSDVICGYTVWHESSYIESC